MVRKKYDIVNRQYEEAKEDKMQAEVRYLHVVLLVPDRLSLDEG